MFVVNWILSLLLMTAWARPPRPPMIEILPTPSFEDGGLEVDLDGANVDPRALAEAWMVRGPVRLPVHQPRVVARRRPITQGLEIQLLEQLIQFVRSFGGDSETTWPGDFRARYLRAISERMPGYAWVVVADQIGVNTGPINSRHTGGAAGIQMPLLGDRAVFLEDGQGHVVLRLMPLGGNYERITARDSSGNMTDAPGNGIVVRPTVEVAGAYRGDGWEPGARLLVQPRIGSPWGEVRMVAEVYLKLEVTTSGEFLRAARIVPRCLVDMTYQPDGRSDVTDPFARSLFQVADRNLACSMNMEFAFGW